MALDHHLRCKHCYGIIQSDIYAHLRLTIDEKTFNFCRQICLDAYLDRCGRSFSSTEQIAAGSKSKALKDEPVKNRWNILDLRQD